MGRDLCRERTAKDSKGLGERWEGDEKGEVVVDGELQSGEGGEVDRRMDEGEGESEVGAFEGGRTVEVTKVWEEGEDDGQGNGLVGIRSVEEVLVPDVGLVRREAELEDELTQRGIPSSICSDGFDEGEEGCSSLKTDGSI